MTTKSNKSENWQKLFDKYSLLESIHSKGYVDITSQQIKGLDNLEPRLLGKIDHEENLPTIFKENNLSILTISNSAYRIGPFDIFMDLPEWQQPGDEVKKVPVPSNFETLDFQRLTSEPQVINAANVSSILENVLEENVELTIAGRHRTPDFEYNVDLYNGKYQKIKVSKAQIEVDAGYEGKNAFYLIEAKNHSATNFNLRQLYYPFRTWTSRIKKPVIPIFLTFSNDVFDFYRFEFAEVTNFSSAKLIKHDRYMLAHQNISIADIDELAKNAVHNRVKANIPFPQADSFERVIDMVSMLLNESAKTPSELADLYSFDPRQSDYYWNAARFLGLAESETGPEGVKLRTASSLAQEIFSLSYRDKYLRLAKLILSIPGVSDLYLDWRRHGKPSEFKALEMVDISKNGKLYSGATTSRRIQTVLSWTNWLICLPDK